MRTSRTPLAEQFAIQILRTCEPFLAKPFVDLRVLDIGCGFGATTLWLAARCRSVTGIDPSGRMIEAARADCHEGGLTGVEFVSCDVLEYTPTEPFDLIVLDNVFEHLPDQPATLQRVADWLAPGGVCYLLTPNKLWPIEAHYHLPFLSYLPLSWANRYLRWSRRGVDYRDSSYAPTYGGLRRLCRNLPGVTAHFVLPADVRLATRGQSWLYRLGVCLLRRWSGWWWVSKALLVVLQRTPK
ncbi:MAG: methyltransferase domain-containing protein [Planctomycetaceae bacterium]